MAATDDRLNEAQAAADQARARLSDNIDTLKNYVAPTNVLDRVSRSARDSGAKALSTGTEAVKANPAILAGVVALGALLFARKPIARLFSKSPKPAPTPAKPARAAPSPARRTPAKRTRAATPRTRKAKS